MLIASPGQAFCPTNGLICAFGAVGNTHKDITTNAVQELDQEFFSASRVTTSMKNAIRDITDANADVDEDQHTSAKHFDGESFTAGHDRLTALFSRVIDVMQDPPDVAGGRQALGQALHTVQDFYAHSNWIELGNSGANASTWRDGQTIGPVSPPTEATCGGTCIFEICLACQSNMTSSNLTSGYYAGEDAVKTNAGKCSHGGLIDLSHGGDWKGINKDTLVCDVSPHALQHDAAAAAAKDATKQFIRDLKDRLTVRQLKLLLGVGPTLAMSIDTTGSMGSIIAGVRQQAIQIVNARIGTDEEPSRYILSPFNDPFVGPLTVTDDPAVFKAAISSLGASGGGDCPELAMAGALAALNAADEGVDLFTFTDATAKDSALSSSVDAVAATKDAKVYPILFGSCSPIDPAYIRLANDTGGQLFFLSPSEAGQIARLADLIVRSNAVDLLSVADTSSGPTKSYDLPVDSTLSQVVFSFSGSTAVTVRRPDGTAVQGSDAGVTFVPLSTGALYAVSAPTPGLWRAEIGGTASFSLNVTGTSSLSLDSFRFVDVGGADPHQGYFPIHREPVVGEPVTAAASLSGNFASAVFSFRDKTGAILQGPIALGRDAGKNDFFGGVGLPVQSFLVYATGQDGSGFAYQRVIPFARRVQTVKVTPPGAQDLHPGATTTYNFTVQNLGAADNFVVSVVDDRGFVTSFAPGTLTLAANGTATVSVVLVPPAGTRGGTSDQLTVGVRSSRDPSVTNFAKVSSTVVNNRPPDCTTGAVTPASLWPPNHAMNSVSITGVRDPDGDPVSLQIDQITMDEDPNAAGDGNTCPDAEILGSNAARVRAERAGSGNGRIYRLGFTASDGRGGTCHGAVNVCVPHNHGDVCQEDASVWDALACH